MLSFFCELFFFLSELSRCSNLTKLFCFGFLLDHYRKQLTYMMLLTSLKVFFVAFGLALATRSVSAFPTPKAATRKTTSSFSTVTIDQVGSSEDFLDPDNGGEASLISPGIQEDDVFDCDDSVSYWKEFKSEGNQVNLQRLISTITNEANRDDLGRAYWGSHIIRTGYFTLNAVTGSFASDLHERFIAGRTDNKDSSDLGLFSKGNGGMLQNLGNSDIPTRLLLEVFRVYDQDYNYIKQGILKFPWDGIIQRDGRLQLNHRQSNPFFALQETLGVVRESVAIFSRRYKQSSKGVFIQRTDPKQSIYPDYYLNDFHYQTDGWFSSESANLYEASTETLFLGRQDAMQRQTLIPLLKSGMKPKKILDVASGTGRFGTFLRDNFPTAMVTISDLSPYYLEKARRNDQYWIKQRGEDAMEEVTGERKEPEPASFVQANAERLPFEDNSFDAVTCVYLFHELPADARQRAAKEMVRVLKPGGMIVLTDSLQLGDRPPIDKQIGGFSNLNEPHYLNYVNTYLPSLFEGCDCGEKYMASSTKTISFVKSQ